jgi:hypothetical protein
MPPKKVIIPPVAGTGDEAALQKEQQVRDGINIEVCFFPYTRFGLRISIEEDTG